jgi:hypothetical protein
MLLVLDNCEQVLDACAELAAFLRRAIAEAPHTVLDVASEAGVPRSSPRSCSPRRLWGARSRLAGVARERGFAYRQLKGELGLDHYEGRIYRGFHHHCVLVTCAHAFLTLERMCPKARRPA